MTFSENKISEPESKEIRKDPEQIIRDWYKEISDKAGEVIRNTNTKGELPLNEQDKKDGVDRVTIKQEDIKLKVDEKTGHRSFVESTLQLTKYTKGWWIVGDLKIHLTESWLSINDGPTVLNINFSTLLSNDKQMKMVREIFSVIDKRLSPVVKEINEKEQKEEKEKRKEFLEKQKKAQKLLMKSADADLEKKLSQISV